MKKNIFLCLLLFSLLSACNDPYSHSRKTRNELAQKEEIDIVIGIAWGTGRNKQTNTGDFFINGLELAVNEINKQPEGVYKNRKITLKLNDGEAKINSKMRSYRQQQIVRNVARSFAADPQVVAVIGHRSSSYAIPASITYKYHDILYVAPTATNLALTAHNFHNVFRLTPDNEEIGKQLAAYCHYAGKYKKMAVFNDRGAYGEELARSFIKRATEEPYNIKIVFRGSFFSYEREFRDTIAELRKQKELDAIFLSASVSASSELIKQSREMGVKADFIGGDGLASSKVWDIAGEAAEGLVVPTLFNETVSMADAFVKKFEAKYGEKPDREAAMGYDAIKLLAHAMREAESSQPLTVATRLRYMPFWLGVTGVHLFDDSGDVYGKKYYFKKLHQGHFEFLPNAHLGYVLELIQNLRKERENNKMVDQ
jgi:branched-chain amino acid transport system substrate-binding protein